MKYFIAVFLYICNAYILVVVILVVLKRKKKKERKKKEKYVWGFLEI